MGATTMLDVLDNEVNMEDSLDEVHNYSWSPHDPSRAAVCPPSLDHLESLSRFDALVHAKSAFNKKPCSPRYDNIPSRTFSRSEFSPPRPVQKEIPSYGIHTQTDPDMHTVGTNTERKNRVVENPYSSNREHREGNTSRIRFMQEPAGVVNSTETKVYRTGKRSPDQSVMRTSYRTANIEPTDYSFSSTRFKNDRKEPRSMTSTTPSAYTATSGSFDDTIKKSREMREQRTSWFINRTQPLH